MKKQEYRLILTAMSIAGVLGCGAASDRWDEKRIEATGTAQYKPIRYDFTCTQPVPYDSVSPNADLPSKERVKSVMSNMQPRMEQECPPPKALKGTVKIKIVMNNEGAVFEATVLKREKVGQSFSACIEEVMKCDARFGRLGGDRKQLSITFPYRF